MNPDFEQQVKEAAMPYIEQGRKGWNVEHVLATVHWIKELIKCEGGNPKILIPVLYFHDAGYAEVLPENTNFEKGEANDIKTEHAIISEQLVRKHLGKMDFTQKEIDEIAHLVRVHDELDNISTSNEQLVFEADSLGQIDRIRVTPNYTGEDYKKWVNYFKQHRAPLFKTETGKKALAELFPGCEHYYDNE